MPLLARPHVPAMPSMKVIFILQVVALWLAVVLLALVTSMAVIASSTRADCGMIRNTTLSIGSSTCALGERISTLVYKQSSYFQSTHIIVVQSIATFALFIFKPSLTAMTWSTLERSESITTETPVPTMKLDALQNGVDLANSPGLLPAVLYVQASRTINHPVFQVFLISILSLISPLALSPVYQPHEGPYFVTTNITIGGGTGPNVSSTLSSKDFVSRGEVAGRAIINTATALMTPVPLLSFDISVAPFIHQDTVRAIWKAQVQTVVARNSIDCGSSAPSRFTRSQNIVSLNTTKYFAAKRAATKGISPSFAGTAMGLFPNDPQMSAVYLNTTTSVQPGAVQAQSSIIFLAANGTLEGAQQRITSPEPTARIMFIDVLVCTSTTTLEISSCSIDKGNVTSCVAVPPASIPGAQSSITGGVENYVTHPGIVASILATSPAKAYYDLEGRIPMYDQITPEMISAGIPPLSFLSVVTTDNLYSIPMSYVQGVLFGQTAQGLVQGMVSTYSVPTSQQLFITSTFGTSQPALLYIVLVLSVSCALSATLANTLTRSVRQAAPMDLVRILAVSRNPQLDAFFGPYSDRNVRMDEGMLDAKVGYTWIDSLQRHALVLSHAPSTVNGHGHVYQSVHTNLGTESTLNTPTLSSSRVVSSGNYTDAQLRLMNDKY
jgi:hypothetical protein